MLRHGLSRIRNAGCAEAFRPLETPQALREPHRAPGPDQWRIPPTCASPLSRSAIVYGGIQRGLKKAQGKALQMEAYF